MARPLANTEDIANELELLNGKLDGILANAPSATIVPG